MKNIIKKLVVLSFVLGFFALGSPSVFAVGAPFIYSATATNITSSSAVLNGVINPNGSSTNAWFKTTTSSSLGYQNVGSGTSSVTMNPYTLTGLTPNTSYQFHVEAQNSIGNTVSSWVYFTTSAGTPPPPPQYPTVNLSANPSSIAYGASSTLSWNSTNATSCSATGGSNGWSGPKNLSGTFYTGNLYNTATYNITCTGAGGSASDSVTVYVAGEPYNPPPPPQYPTVNLSANPTSVSYNGSSTLSWNSTNATSCSATGGSNGWSGPKNLSGTFYTGNLTNTTSYNITCTGAGGSASDSVTVIVGSQPYNPPPTPTPTVNLTANPMNVSYNGTSMLTWNSTNATSCNATGGSNGWSGYKNTSGTFYTGTLSSTLTYSITCTGAGGSASDSVTVYVTSNPPPQTPLPIVNIWADNSDLSYGGSTTLYWTSSNSTSCSGSEGSNGWSGTKGISGSFFTGNLYQNTNYLLTCYNSSGSGSDSVTVSVQNTNNHNDIPSVTTNPATNIDDSSATLRGTVDSNGGNVTAWFEWDTNNSFNKNTTHQYFGNTNGINFSYNLTGLDNDHVYYFRAVAQNTNGQIVYGSTRNFTTNNDGNNCDTNNSNCDVPNVTTNAATNIDNNSATLRGEVDPNGTARTWFEWGRSRSDLNENTSKSSRSSSSRSFSEDIDGLRAGTTYYFRAVAENDEGIDRGNIRSFVTDDSGRNNNSCDTGFCAPQAVTTLATNVGSTSARLNGLGIINGNALTTGYFEWGTTAFLGATTGSTIIGSTGSNPYFFSLFGLASNTTYFYRAVVVNQYGTSRGDISTFRTLGGAVLGSSTTIVRNTTVVTNDNIGTSKPSLVLLTVDRDNEVVRVGEIVDYNIYYKNISQKNLRDVVLRISIPKELQFMESTRGYFSEENNTVVVNIGDLSPQEEGNVVVTVKVVTNAEIGKVIVITANLVYTIVNTDTQEEVFAYSKNTIEAGSVLGASAFFGGSFLPNSLIGWLLLLLIILLIILAARAGYNNTRPQKVITYEEKHTTTS